MVCPACRCPGAPCQPFEAGHEDLEVFDVVLDENCFRRMYIPCNVRAFLADYIEEQRDVARTLQYAKVEPGLLTFESKCYPALFKHRPTYTKFHGSAWYAKC